VAALSDDKFWKDADKLVGRLQTDGPLSFMLLDNAYRMQPLIRKQRTTFTDFLAADPDAKKCKIIVNGNFYGLDKSGKASVFRGNPDDPSDTEIQGQIIIAGNVVAGDSRPLSFWFGQVAAPSYEWKPEPWVYTAGKGDPPAEKSTLAALGGIGPLLIGQLRYGVGNLYSGCAPGVGQPATGEPPQAAMACLIQRNNETFRSANEHPDETGKVILAFNPVMLKLLVVVQQHGVTPGRSLQQIAFDLYNRGFQSGVFLDGSDSATMVVDGKVVIAPGDRKNNSIDVGVGFFK
jgi:hypothetical protein